MEVWEYSKYVQLLFPPWNVKYMQEAHDLLPILVSCLSLLPERSHAEEICKFTAATHLESEVGCSVQKIINRL